MKVRKLNDGEIIEVGDRIKVELGALGTRWEVIHRVTPKFAFVLHGTNEGKYRREYRHFGFHELPYERTIIKYSAWRPVSPAAQEPSNGEAK